MGANGEAERFMQSINKVERIIARHTKDKHQRQYILQEFLTAYRDTPHLATGVSPYQAMQSGTILTKLDYHDYTTPQKIQPESETKIQECAR